MNTVSKVCACVVRNSRGRNELLAFEHPNAGVQLPKGGLQPGEHPADGVVRELHEETGLHGLAVTARLGALERQVGAGPDESGPLERHVWEVFLMPGPPDAPDQWQHEVWGSPEEEGLIFRCHWLPIDEHLPDALHPLFGPVVTLLVDHLTGRSAGR